MPVHVQASAATLRPAAARAASAPSLGPNFAQYFDYLKAGSALRQDASLVVDMYKRTAEYAALPAEKRQAAVNLLWNARKAGDALAVRDTAELTKLASWLRTGARQFAGSGAVRRFADGIDAKTAEFQRSAEALRARRAAGVLSGPTQAMVSRGEE